MKIKILLSLLTIAATSAFARIGYTPEQCQICYDKPVQINKDGLHIYRKAASAETFFLLGVQFSNGKTVLIGYSKCELNGTAALKLSDNEIETLLNLNAGQEVWNVVNLRTGQFGRKSWMTEKLFATYDLIKNTLSIYTKDSLREGAAADKAKENNALKDF